MGATSKEFFLKKELFCFVSMAMLVFYELNSQSYCRVVRGMRRDWIGFVLIVFSPLEEEEVDLSRFHSLLVSSAPSNSLWYLSIPSSAIDRRRSEIVLVEAS